MAPRPYDVRSLSEPLNAVLVVGPRAAAGGPFRPRPGVRWQPGRRYTIVIVHRTTRPSAADPSSRHSGARVSGHREETEAAPRRAAVAARRKPRSPRARDPRAVLGKWDRH